MRKDDASTSSSGVRRLEIDMAPDGTRRPPGPTRRLGGALLLAHFADVAASNDRVIVEMANGRSVAGQIGFPLLDQRLLPFWVPDGGQLPALVPGPVRIQYHSAGALLSLETTATPRWKHILWMLRLPVEVEVPGVRLAGRHKMPGWQVLLRRGKMRAGVPLVNLSTIGVQFRTPSDALAPVQGDVFEAALLNRDQSVEIPIRARAVRRKVAASGAVAVGARFRGIGLNSIVRIATLIRVAEAAKRRGGS